MDKNIIIGKREKAILGMSTYIFYFVLSFILFFFTILFLTFLFIKGIDGVFVLGFIIGIVSFGGLGVMFLLFGLDKIKIVKNNNLCDKDCLTYDSTEKKFIVYDVRTNLEIKLNKEDVFRIYGSKFGTNNELYVLYKCDSKVKKINCGYCSNIEHESFNLELSKVINPSDVGL